MVEPMIEQAEYRLYLGVDPGTVFVAILVTVDPSGIRPKPPRGWLTGKGNWREPLVLLESSRAKLSGYANGAFGGFSDTYPWVGSGVLFTKGSPIANDPAIGKNATWGELSLELGLYGITQIGLLPLFLYGNMSIMETAELGQDLFMSGERDFFAVGKAYAGLLYAPTEGRTRTRVNVSAGRQPFQLNEGFLISRYSGSANAGERASLDLNSRLAFEKTVLGTVQVDHVSLEGFFLEPQELDLSVA